MADTTAKIVLSAEDRTSRVFSGLRANLGSISSQASAVSKAFVGLAPAIAGAFTVVGLTSFLRNVVNGIDNLNDLSDATGSTVEKLSGLEDFGARTGTSLDTISAALLKLNKNLLEARDPASEAAGLFKALGLNAAELSKQDPSDALLRVSTALNGFANNAEKGQFQLALLGKSTRQLAPFLKDLAEAGEINGTVTQKQADAADLFNKQLFQLQKNATDAARVIAGPVVSSINELIGSYQEARTEGQGLFEFLARGYARLAKDNLKLLGLGGLGGPAENRQKASGVVTIETPETPRPTIQLPEPGGKKGGGGSAAKARLSDAQQYLENLQRQLQGTQDLSVAETVLADIQAGRLKLAKGESAQPLLDIATQIDQAKRRQDQLKAEAEQVRQLRAEQEKLSSSAAAVFEATRTPAEKFGAELGDIQELMQKGAIDTDTYYRRVAQLREEFDKLSEAKETIDELDTFTQRAAQNIQDALGDELANVLDGNFKSIGDSFAKLLNRMVAEAAAAQIARALFGDLLNPGKSSGGGGDSGFLGGLLKSGAQFLGGFGKGLFSGGAATGSNMLERDMITLLHKGEAVIPKQYNPAAGGSGGRAITVNINQTFGQNTSRQTTAQAAADARRALEAGARNL
jgi:hypothetical protein